MLIISRKKDQKIVIADDIEIMILEIGRNRVRFGINAPRSVPINTKIKDGSTATTVNDAILEAVSFESAAAGHRH